MLHALILQRLPLSCTLGTVLANGSADNTIRLWTYASGATVQTLEAQDDIHSIAFSSDGKTLAGGGNTLKFWDVLSRLKKSAIQHSVA